MSLPVASLCSFSFLHSTALDKYFTFYLSILPTWTPLWFTVCNIMNNVAMNIVARVFCFTYMLFVAQFPHLQSGVNNSPYLTRLL